MQATFSSFTTEAEAIAELEAAGYQHMTIDFPAEANDTHWHDFDATIYILDGSVELTDGVTGEATLCTAGSKVSAPAGCLHRETTDGYRAIIGVSIAPENITEPVNKPPPVTL
ncbi:MAG: hypothetical protein AAGI11_00995 [Pseudomonadota bacterium]